MKFSDSGAGYGYGDMGGFGDILASGSGHGSGAGYDNGYGYGAGAGYGSGAGFDNGYGYGAGAGYGSGAGFDNGYGGGAGFDNGYGYGKGATNLTITIDKNNYWVAYHFIKKSKNNYIMRSGEKISLFSHVHEDDIKVCAYGLHASLSIKDAVKYAPKNSFLTKVKIWGKIQIRSDKIVATDRLLLQELGPLNYYMNIKY